MEEEEVILTEEEASQEITLERINEYHYAVGEDFIDQNESILNGTVFAGWMLCRYPQWATEILKELNSKYFGIQNLMEVYEDDNGEYETFYKDFCELVNLTVSAKARVNKVLKEYSRK
ncbi:MAG: hypothetical protein ABIP51_18295 [Bacteroidia bacterium]